MDAELVVLKHSFSAISDVSGQNSFTVGTVLLPSPPTVSGKMEDASTAPDDAQAGEVSGDVGC